MTLPLTEERPSIVTVALYIIDKHENSNNEPLETEALYRLLLHVQGHGLAMTGRPVYDDPLFALPDDREISPLIHYLTQGSPTVSYEGLQLAWSELQQQLKTSPLNASLRRHALDLALQVLIQPTKGHQPRQITTTTLFTWLSGATEILLLHQQTVLDPSASPAIKALHQYLITT